jgi:hypothetical protein
MMERKTSVRVPRIALIGTFSDVFLEGITELGYDFKLCSDELGVKKRAYDILVIAPDRNDSALESVCKFGSVPVMSVDTVGFEQFDPIKEEGNAFMYSKGTPWHMLEGLIKAVETFKFVYDWKTVKAELKDILDQYAVA